MSDEHRRYLRSRGQILVHNERRYVRQDLGPGRVPVREETKPRLLMVIVNSGI